MIGVGLFVILVIILIIVFSGKEDESDNDNRGPTYLTEDIGSVRATLRLDKDFNEIEERDEFEENFRNSLSEKLEGVEPGQVIIKHITEGSIIVEFVITPPSNDLTEEELTNFQNEISGQLETTFSDSGIELTGSTVNVIDESDISVVTPEFVELNQRRLENDGVAETTFTRDCQGEWSDWGDCSALCGGGTQQRSYTVSRTKLGNGAACSNTDGETEERACNTATCMHCQGGWSDWGDCSFPCGGGTQQREYTVTREAGPGGESCSNETGDTEERACNTDECIPCQGEWSDWGDCSAECGGGVQRKTYTITREAGPGGWCAYADGAWAERSCNTDACVSCQGEWSDWGDCNRQCGGGVQQKTYTVTREAGPGGESCDHATGDTASRGCNTHDCQACEGRWYNPLATDPTAFMQGCSVSCGGGTLTERYEITNPGEPGGTPCEANDGDERTVECNTQACTNIHEENLPENDHVPTTDCRHLQRSDKIYDVDALNACMNSLSPTGRTYTENTKNCDWDACDDYGYPREDTIIAYEFELDNKLEIDNLAPMCKLGTLNDDPRGDGNGKQYGKELVKKLCQLWGHSDFDFNYIKNQPDTNYKATGSTQGKWPPHSCQITDNSGNFIPYVAKRQSSVYHKQIDSIKCI